MSSARRLFLVLALTCGAAWLAKVALIAANGGERTDGGSIGVLWALGMVALVGAAASGTAALLGGRPLWLVVPACLVAAPLAFGATGLVDAAVKAAYPDGGGWLRDELGLLVVAAALAVAALPQLRRAQDGPTEVTEAHP